MTTASEKMIQAIEYIVKPLSVGTNLAILHVLWAMVTGAFLQSRGAVHTALKMSGRTDSETKRGTTALRTGSWQIGELIERWREWVLANGEWSRREYEGWYALSCDVIVFPRLKLKGWVGKLYRGTFGRAVKAVGFGLIVEVGQYGTERSALLQEIVRSRNVIDSETQLQSDLLKAAAKQLGERGVFVHDAGVTVKAVQAAKMERFVIRLGKNCVARWNYLPTAAHGNRRKGDVIRPLARSRKGKAIAATDDPTTKTTFVQAGRLIQAWQWTNVVGYDERVSADADTYDIWVFLTRCMMNRSLWRPILKRQLPPFSVCTMTVGVWSSYH